MKIAIYPALVWGTDYQDVPYSELSRGRYLHLAQILDTAASAALAALEVA